MTQPKKYTWDDIKATKPKKMNSETISKQKEALIVIKNKVYNVGGEFENWHPGGSVALTQIGMDATGSFEGFHDPKTFLELKKFYVGDLLESEIKDTTEFEKDVQKIRAIIQKRGWYQASFVYYLTLLSIILALGGSSLAIIAHFPDQFIPLVLSSLLMGVAFQQSGWLTHDFLHHQFFQKRWIGNVVGYILGNVFQGFSVGWWKQKHCTHHAAPNVHSHDPDIDTLPFLAWSEHALEGFQDVDDAALSKLLVKYQYVLIFPLLSFARLSWAINSIFWNFTTKRVLQFPSLPLVERALLAVHYTWYLGSAFYFLSPVYAITWALLCQVLCGIFLSTVFSLNHNGMPVYSTKDASEMNFYELAIRTGRNVHPGLFNNWFTGGLNFQIEHHMFPTVPRHNLPKTSEMVKALCVKHNIPYHTTNMYDGMVEIVERLSNVSRLAKLKSH